MTVYDLVKRHEGFRGAPYDCGTGIPLRAVKGHVTVGYGRNLEANPFTEAEAGRWLYDEVERLRVELAQEFSWFLGLDEVRMAVLLDMAYNMGIGGVLKFSATLGYIEAGAYHEAAAEMLHSAWARQVPERARDLSEMMKTGAW